MANLAIVYGLRLLPADELEGFEEAKIKLKNGHTASVTMHLIEGGNEEEIKRQLLQSLDAFFDKASESTTGEVTLRLYKGGIQPVSRKSPYSLYSLDIASFTMGASYDQKDALGFINLIGLPIKVRAAVEKAAAEKAAAEQNAGEFAKTSKFAKTSEFAKTSI